MTNSKDGWLWRGSAQKQTRPKKIAEAEREWRNYEESQRRWCRAVTCQTVANHRACETGKQRYQQVISIIGSLPSLNISCQTSNCRLLASHIIHVLPKRSLHYMRMCVLLTLYMSSILMLLSCCTMKFLCEFFVNTHCSCMRIHNIAGQ